MCSRIVPATWTGAAGDFLASTAGNWDTNQVPLGNESIVYSAAFSTSCVIDANFGGVVANMTMQAGYAGTVTVASNLNVTGALSVAASAPAALLQIDATLFTNGGSLSGGARLGGGGRLEVSGGTLTAAATEFAGPSVLVSAGATLTFTGDVTFDGSRLDNLGVVNWNDGNITVRPFVLVSNYGQFEIQNDRTIIDEFDPDIMDHGSFLNNSGTVTKTGGAAGGQTRIEVPSQQDGGDLRLNGRTINFQGGLIQNAANSTTYLDNGTLIVMGVFTVTAGNVVGFGTIQGSLKLAGGMLDLTTEAGAGTVRITGNYEQTAGGTLKLKVGRVGGQPVRDRLDITGTATLGGALTVTQVGNAPQAGNQFEIITAAGGRNGTFAQVTLPPLPGGLTWAPPNYGANSVTLIVNQ